MSLNCQWEKLAMMKHAFYFPSKHIQPNGVCFSESAFAGDFMAFFNSFHCFFESTPDSNLYLTMCQSTSQYKKYCFAFRILTKFLHQLWYKFLHVWSVFSQVHCKSSNGTLQLHFRLISEKNRRSRKCITMPLCHLKFKQKLT